MTKRLAFQQKGNDMTTYFNSRVRTVRDACDALLVDDLRTLFAGNPDMLRGAERAFDMLCAAFTGIDGARLGDHPLIKAVDFCDVCEEPIWDEEFGHPVNFEVGNQRFVHDNCCPTCEEGRSHR